MFKRSGALVLFQEHQDLTKSILCKAYEGLCLSALKPSNFCQLMKINELRKSCGVEESGETIKWRRLS